MRKFFARSSLFPSFSVAEHQLNRQLQKNHSGCWKNAHWSVCFWKVTSTCEDSTEVLLCERMESSSNLFLWVLHPNDAWLLTSDHHPSVTRLLTTLIIVTFFDTTAWHLTLVTFFDTTAFTVTAMTNGLPLDLYMYSVVGLVCPRGEEQIFGPSAV